MSSIVSTRRTKQGVVLEVRTRYENYLQLKGHLDRVYLFTENTGLCETKVSHRGMNSSTKYFLIPRELRKGLRLDAHVSCQRIDEEDKTFFIYVLDNLRKKESKKEALSVPLHETT